MKSASFLFLDIAALLLFPITQLVLSQIVGCDGPGIDCPNKHTDSPVGSVCKYVDYAENNGIGAISFNSSITSDGPLTWTLASFDETRSWNHYAERDFWLGYRAPLDLEHKTDFGGCAMSLTNVSRLLQTPVDFTDFANFGCHTMMSTQCIKDFVDLVRADLLQLLNDSDYVPLHTNFHYGYEGISPCQTIAERHYYDTLPESCFASFGADPSVGQDKFSFANPRVLTNNVVDPFTRYEAQQNCSLSPEGSDYLLVGGMQEISDFIVDGKGPKDQVKLFKNGTTPMFTLFYNEPWNNKSTGPVPFLVEPEVHMSCLMTVPSEGQKTSAAAQLGRGLDKMGLVLAIAGTVLAPMILSLS